MNHQSNYVFLGFISFVVFSLYLDDLSLITCSPPPPTPPGPTAAAVAFTVRAPHDGEWQLGNYVVNTMHVATKNMQLAVGALVMVDMRTLGSANKGDQLKGTTETNHYERARGSSLMQ